MYDEEACDVSGCFDECPTNTQCRRGRSRSVCYNERSPDVYMDRACSCCASQRYPIGVKMKDYLSMLREEELIFKNYYTSLRSPRFFSKNKGKRQASGGEPDNRESAGFHIKSKRKHAYKEKIGRELAGSQIKCRSKNRYKEKIGRELAGAQTEVKVKKSDKEQNDRRSTGVQVNGRELAGSDINGRDKNGYKEKNSRELAGSDINGRDKNGYKEKNGRELAGAQKEVKVKKSNKEQNDRGSTGGQVNGRKKKKKKKQSTGIQIKVFEDGEDFNEENEADGLNYRSRIRNRNDSDRKKTTDSMSALKNHVKRKLDNFFDNALKEGLLDPRKQKGKRKGRKTNRSPDFYREKYGIETYCPHTCAPICCEDEEEDEKKE